MNQSALNKLMTQVADFSTLRIAIVGLILAAIYYVTFFNDGSALRLNIQTLNTQIEEEKVKKVDTTRILQKEEQMRADVTMLVKKYEEVKAKIPIEFLESELRILIDKIAEKNEIRTNKSQRGTKGKDFGTSQDATLVDQVVLEYTFSGTFFKLEKFIREVSNLDKLIMLEDISLIVNRDKIAKSDVISRDSIAAAAAAANSKEITLNTVIVGFKQSSASINENKKEGKK